MKKKLFSVGLLSVLLTTGSLLVTGCSDSDYDFNNVDATMGFGGDGLELPVSSTADIPLKDVLDLEADGCVTTDVNGNYLFQLSGNTGSSDVKVINPIRLAFQQVNREIPLNSATRSKASRAVLGSINYTSPKIEMFEYIGTESSLVSLETANIEEVTMKITFDLSGLHSAVQTIKTAKLTLPAYLNISGLYGNGNGVPTREGSSVVVTNVSTDRNLVLTLKVNSLDFTEKNDHGDLVIEQDGTICLNGYFSLSIEADVTGSSSNMSIGTKVEANEMVATSATGQFDPKINIDLGNEIGVNGVPDFLSDEQVIADLDNPQIILTLHNDMDIAAQVTAKVMAFDKGHNQLAAVQLPMMDVARNSVSSITKLCVCRKKTADMVSQYGEANVYEVSDLSTLVRRIPKYVKIENVVAKVTPNQIGTIVFGRSYDVNPNYEVYAPLAFGRDAVIEYSDDFDGWNDDIKDLSLTEGTYLTLTANAENKVPANLILEATPLGVDGNDISNLVEVDIVKGTVVASTDGATVKESPLEVKISEKQKDGLQKLDGLSFKVLGKATDGETSVTGITLNAEKHTLKLKDIKIKLVGKVIGDFN